MTDRFDRASTLNFTTVARVRGPLSEAQLQRALRCLEMRHPLLRAQLVRAEGETSLAAGGAEIPLQIIDAGEAQVAAAAAGSLEHRDWSDAGPRAELTWFRHGHELGTLLLCLHHVVSDGSSGVLAMRDLLSFVAGGDPNTVAVLPSPGQDSFLPASQAELRASFLQQAAAGGAPRPRPAARVGSLHDVPFEQRKVGLRRLQLSLAESEALSSRARSEGATVHGVLTAALSLAVAAEQPDASFQRIAHPVDLRRYLRALDPHAPTVGEAVGYYVSSVTTEHELTSSHSLSELAREITSAVRAAKSAGEPLLSAPIRGPYMVERTAAMDVPSFRAFAEQKVFGNTYGLTNLGRLELLGVAAQIRELEVEDLFFVAAHSVMAMFGGSAVSFRGRIALQLTHVMPFVSAELADRLLQRVQEQLQQYAG